MGVRVGNPTRHGESEHDARVEGHAQARQPLLEYVAEPPSIAVLVHLTQRVVEEVSALLGVPELDDLQALGEGGEMLTGLPLAPGRVAPGADRWHGNCLSHLPR
jgi:hypothetical protein